MSTANKQYVYWRFIMGSHQKKGKKFHNSCELSPKMENLPPPPTSQQFQPLLELENLCFFAIIIIRTLRLTTTDETSKIVNSFSFTI